MTICPITPDDKSAWLELWQHYLDFYGTSLSPEQTDLTFNRFLDTHEDLSAFVAFDDAGKMIGFAHTLEHRSTFAPIGYLYLEDLFVAPSARNQGTATRLIEHVAAHASNQGLSRIHWETQTDNPARKLYDRLASCVDFVQYRKQPMTQPS